MLDKSEYIVIATELFSQENKEELLYFLILCSFMYTIRSKYLMFATLVMSFSREVLSFGSKR